MNIEFRLGVLKQIEGVERAVSSASPTAGVLCLGDQKMVVVFQMLVETASDKNRYLLESLKALEDYVGVVANKVLSSPVYHGYFSLAAPNVPMTYVKEIEVVSPQCKMMLASEVEEINCFLKGRNVSLGHNAVHMKLEGLATSILRVVSSLHGKHSNECLEEMMTLSAYAGDDEPNYLLPWVLPHDRNFMWGVRLGRAVPASMLTSPQQEKQAKKALKFYQNCPDAQFQPVVVAALRAQITKAESTPSDEEDRFVRPVRSIEFLADQSELSLEDSSIVARVFTLANARWIESLM